MIVGTYSHHPDAIEDIHLDWGALHLGDDTITASSWTVQEGLTADSDTSDDTTTALWISGGTAERIYYCDNIVETSGGRTEVATVKVICTTGVSAP